AMTNRTADSAKPTSEIVVPTTDQVLNVVTVSKPQNLPISQKPESFTCDQPMEAAPIAITTAETATPLKSPATIAGAMIDAPVVAATVAEPCAMRIAMETMYAAHISCRPIASRPSATCSPIPVSVRITPKAPPPPVMRMMDEPGASASSTNSSCSPPIFWPQRRCGITY